MIFTLRLWCFGWCDDTRQMVEGGAATCPFHGCWRWLCWSYLRHCAGTPQCSGHLRYEGQTFVRGVVPHFQGVCSSRKDDQKRLQSVCLALVNMKVEACGNPMWIPPTLCRMMLLHWKLTTMMMRPACLSPSKTVEADHLVESAWTVGCGLEDCKEW